MYVMYEIILSTKTVKWKINFETTVKRFEGKSNKLTLASVTLSWWVEKVLPHKYYSSLFKQ